jgi:LuxR family transcriptional regulator, maltose regulon positive regulatory protein
VATLALEKPGTAPFDLYESKLNPPVLRPEIVSRTGLVNRLRAGGAPPITALVAPAGYGKTTTLAQWAQKDARRFAWLTIDERDNDPNLLLKYVAAALSRVDSIDSSALEGLGKRRASSWSSDLPRIASALAGAARPVVLVLDDIHLLHAKKGIELIARLADQIPEGSTLVLAGRTLPRLRMARWRASGRLAEISVDELALTRREADVLLRRLGIELAETEIAALIRSTEGWVTGLYLAALALADENGTNGTVLPFAGDDRFVTDYFRSEYLSHIREKDVRFLTRTAILDRMSASLCDAVLEIDGSGRTLESIERSNLFLVPLDHHREWYRYHHLFKDMLRAELEHREPELVPTLNKRAAAWAETNGSEEAAVGYASAAGDLDTVARLVTSHALPYNNGRMDMLETWLESFEGDSELERYPAVAVLGGWLHALRGRSQEAERLLRVAERGTFAGVLPDGSTSVKPWIALLRAAMCDDGPSQMLTDAELGLRGLAKKSEWRPSGLLLRGAAQLLLDEVDAAEASLAEAADVATAVGDSATQAVALSELSLVAAARHDYIEAGALAGRARELVDEGLLANDVVSAIVFAVSARAELRRGRPEQSRADLAKADRLRPELTDALPWYSVQTRLELARTRVALLDSSGAKTLLSEANRLMGRHPGLGVLSKQADRLEAETAAIAGPREQSSMLTAAELRLLPLLTTHMSFREIGEHLYVSRNTVKTQAISVYRKLSVSSRSEAIERAGELGLVEAAFPSIHAVGQSTA